MLCPTPNRRFVPTADVIKEAANCGDLTFSKAASGLCQSWFVDCRDRFVLRMMVDRSKHWQLQFYCSAVVTVGGNDGKI
jgi:hypothetical protein